MSERPGDMIHLVRHAKAGDRSGWHGDDRLRPLSKKGHRQAEAIADRLAATATELRSSPYLRCTETLAPLAARLGRAVVVDECLAEGGAFEPVLELMAAAPDGTVLCSHGDIVPDVLVALERRGCRIVSGADWRKGVVWSIERDGDEWRSASAWYPGDGVETT